MTAKEFLNNLYYIERTIRRKKELVSDLKDMAVNVGSPSFDDMPKSKDPEHSKLPDFMCKIINAEEEIKDLENDLHEKKLKLIDILSNVEDTTSRSILMKRILYRMPWKEISRDMHYTMRWVEKLYRRALEDMTAAMKEMGL